MRKRIVSLLLMIGCALPVSADSKPLHEESLQKPGVAVVGAISVDATVESINYDTRQVTLKKEDGTTVSFKVGDVARNFNQVKKGDRVTFKYLEAIAVDIQKASGELSEDIDLSVARAPLGKSPAGTITGTYTLKASVEAIDYDSRNVTLKGPEGNTVTLKIGEQAKRFNEVKKGDQVVVQYTEALGVSVSTPKS